MLQKVQKVTALKWTFLTLSQGQWNKWKTQITNHRINIFTPNRASFYCNCRPTTMLMIKLHKTIVQTSPITVSQLNLCPLFDPQSLSQMTSDPGQTPASPARLPRRPQGPGGTPQACLHDIRARTRTAAPVCPSGSSADRIVTTMCGLGKRGARG